MLSVRPKVAELAFHVFSRTLHPELYSVHKTRRISRSRYEARIDITNCGHVIKWVARDKGSPGEFHAHGHGGLSGDAGSPAELCDAVTGAPRDFTLCEVATSAQTPLPKQRCLISKSLKGSRTEHARCRGGIEYRTHFQLEPVEPDLFWMVGQQLGNGPTEGLLHNFDASGRMALGALSYINIETRRTSMLVQAIHTFPDDYAIVKVESLFSLPG